jgi:hypothetical protein
MRSTRRSGAPRPCYIQRTVRAAAATRTFLAIATLASPTFLLAACPPSSDCEVLLTCGPANEGTGASTASSGGTGTTPDGDPCTTPNECTSGFCTDGLCCASACDGTCEACNVVDSEGTCTAHTVGTDPEMECAPGSCDASGACATGSHVWSFGLATGGDVSGTSLAVDSTGSVLIAGTLFQGSIDFGDGAVTGGPTGFVAKYSASGTFLWKRLLTGTGGISNLVMQVRTDGANDVYVSGWFETATLTIGSTTHTNASGLDLFLGKYTASGTPLWSKRFGNAGGSQRAPAFDVNAAGRIFLAGAFTGPLNLGGATFGSSPYLFAASYDGGGNHLWSKAVGANSSSLDSQVGGGGIDGDGNTYLAGYFRVRAAFGGPVLDDPVETPAVGPLFLAKLVALNGNHGWSHAYGDDALEGPFTADVRLDAGASGACVAGRFLEDFDLGGGMLPLSGGAAFFAGFDLNGMHVWSRNTDAQVAGTAAHNDGTCAAVGTFSGAPDFGGGVLPTSGGSDLFAVKYAPGGAHLWSHKFGDAQNQPPFVHVAIAPDGSVALFGTNSDVSTIDFGGGPIPDHFYVAKLEP